MTDHRLPPSPDISSGKWERVPPDELPRDEAGGLVGWTFAGREYDHKTFPHVIIATDALNMIPGIDFARCRKPGIVADAAHAILVREAAGFHGRFLIDEDVLREAGVTDFARYAVDPSQSPLPDLFL